MTSISGKMPDYSPWSSPSKSTSQGRKKLSALAFAFRILFRSDQSTQIIIMLSMQNSSTIFHYTQSPMFVQLPSEHSTAPTMSQAPLYLLEYPALSTHPPPLGLTHKAGGILPAPDGRVPLLLTHTQEGPAQLPLNLEGHVICTSLVIFTVIPQLFPCACSPQSSSRWPCERPPSCACLSTASRAWSALPSALHSATPWIT